MLAFSQAAETSRPGDNLPAGWSALDDTQLRRLGIDPTAINGTDSTALNATVYTDGRGHYVLAFAGSSGQILEPWRSDSVDWKQDDLSALDGLAPTNTSQQAQRAADVAMQLKAAVGGDHLQITGHSLGGRDAAVASIATGVHAVTFNAAATTDEDLMYADELRGRHVSLLEYGVSTVTGGAYLDAVTDQSSVTNYAITDDVVTNAEYFVGRHPTGDTTTVPTDTPNPFDAHHLDNFDGKV